MMTKKKKKRKIRRDKLRAKKQAMQAFEYMAKLHKDVRHAVEFVENAKAADDLMKTIEPSKANIGKLRDAIRNVKQALLFWEREVDEMKIELNELNQESVDIEAEIGLVDEVSKCYAKRLAHLESSFYDVAQIIEVPGGNGDVLRL